MTITPEVLIARQTHHCVTPLITTLAAGVPAKSHNTVRGHCLYLLAKQTQELSAPVYDYEAAAREVGWKVDAQGGIGLQFCINTYLVAEDWEDACNQTHIEPYQHEILSYWSVSNWFADELLAVGEKVDKQFAGMAVWARTAISPIAVHRICAALNERQES